MTDPEIIIAHCEAHGEISTMDAHRILPPESRNLAHQILMRLFQDKQLVPCGGNRFLSPVVAWLGRRLMDAMLTGKP